jgi:hypothetical protein
VTKSGFSASISLPTLPVRPVTLDVLRVLAPGTARVQRTTLHGDETLVTLGYPRGQQVEVRVPVVPAGPHEIAGLRRPLAVHVDNRREQVECSVLGTSWSGPRRLRISLGHALALAHSGVHTVVVTS